MASSSKPTAVHFTLVFFVLTTLILGVALYLNIQSYVKASEDLENATKEKNAQSRLVTKKDNELQALKRRLGHELAEVGLDSAEPGTVLGDMGAFLQETQQALATQAEPDHAPVLVDIDGGTYKAAIEKLADRLGKTQMELNEEKGKTAQQQATILALESQYNERVKAAEVAQNEAESDLGDVRANKEEALREVRTQLSEAQTNYQRAQADLEDQRREYEKALSKLRQENSDLIAANDKLKADLDDAVKVSFERPDGQIRWVDNLSRMVWIDLGEVDALPVRTTFSVYTKDHHGVARGGEDIKGSIEVTRIIGPHLAEARVLEEDNLRPMAEGDPIYTPLWSRGTKEAFSVVGILDLDNDEKPDRELFHEIVGAAGAEIDYEVLSDGRRIQYVDFKERKFREWQEDEVGIDVDNKFLIVAEMPDPNDVATEEEKQQIESMYEHRTQMIKEARRQGIRVVNLPQFLSYIGYVPRQRLFVPGESKKYTLKSGAQSTAVSETIGNRESSGQVSGAYTRSGRLKKQNTSSGQTSKLYGSGN